MSLDATSWSAILYPNVTPQFARWSGEHDARSCPHHARPRSSPPVPPCDSESGERSAPSAWLEALIRAYPSSPGLAGSGTSPLSALWRGSRPKPVKTEPDYTDAMLHPYCKRMTGPTNSLLSTDQPCCKRCGLVANGCLRPPPGALPSDRSSTSLGRKGSPAARCPSPGHTPCCKSPRSRRSGCCWACSSVRATPIFVASVLQTRPALRFQLPGDCYQVGVLPGLLGGPFKIFNL